MDLFEAFIDPSLLAEPTTSSLPTQDSQWLEQLLENENFLVKLETSPTPAFPALHSNNYSPVSIPSPEFPDWSIVPSAATSSSVELREDPDPHAEVTAEMLAKMTPKERRQMRNKMSARLFRQRKKEYVSTLEQQIKQQQDQIKSLESQLRTMEKERDQWRLKAEIYKAQSASKSIITPTAKDIYKGDLQPSKELNPWLQRLEIHHVRVPSAYLSKPTTVNDPKSNPLTTALALSVIDSILFLWMIIPSCSN